MTNLLQVGHSRRDGGLSLMQFVDWQGTFAVLIAGREAVVAAVAEDARRGLGEQTNLAAGSGDGRPDRGREARGSAPNLTGQGRNKPRSLTANTLESQSYDSLLCPAGRDRIVSTEAPRFSWLTLLYRLRGS